MKKLACYLKPFKKQCIIGPLCKLTEAILEVLLPTIMAYVINKGVGNHDIKIVVGLGTLMIVMVFIGFGFSMTCQYNAALASQGFGTNLRNVILRHISSFSYQDIDAFSTASLSNRLINDVNQLQVAVAMLIRLVIRSPFIIIGAILMSMTLDLKLSLLLLASVPFIILILFVFIRFSSPLYRNYQKMLDHFAQILDDNFSGVRIIRANVSQREEKKKFNTFTDSLQSQMMKVSHYSSLLNPLTALVVNGVIVFLLWFGILQIDVHGMEAGTIIAFINYATQILIALIATGNLIVIFTKAAACAQRINEVLEHIPSIQEGKEEIKALCEDAIDFQNVAFSYDGGANVLHDISFQIHKYETVGIIGGTGAGKSSLVHLIARFYDAQHGHISLFKQPIQTLSNHALRNCVSIVSQTNELFSDTIYHNLVMQEQYSDEEVEKALEDAQAMEFISALKDGWNTKLERGGANFSGGQKQRLCIARALLRKSPILILDDSCSALDFKTDAALRKALKTYKTTQLIVSQRVGTLLNCNRIMVLNNGELVGFDTHQNLYTHCKIYREICETQNIGRDVV